MVLTAVLAAGAVVPVLLAMMKKTGAPVPLSLGLAIAVAAAFVAAARADAGMLPAWWLPVPWLVSVVGVPLALADARHRRLPDVLTLPAYPAVALTLTLAAFGGGGWRLAAGAAVGCLLFGGTHLIVHRLSAGGLGPGDVKLAGSFGAVLGAVGGLAPAVGAVLAATVSAVAVVPMWLMRRIRAPRASVGSHLAAGPSAPSPRSLATGGIAPNQSERSTLTGSAEEPAMSGPAQPPGAAQLADPAEPTDVARAPAPRSLTAGGITPNQPERSTLTGSAQEPAAAGPVPLPGAAQLADPAEPPGPAQLDPAQPPEPTDVARAPALSDSSRMPVGRARIRALADRALARRVPAMSDPARAPAPADRTPIRAGPLGAGPLRVPYGPGLVLATWACAVFPAAGTGIA
ncbi:prepilin peptidase [Amycolatopsis sp. WGS_07]|uniref:prepilin peptidase n=1 Tax=Amycolatopsis sp. WGS_07 TaxID=3076764 RepID=UPI0038737860